MKLTKQLYLTDSYLKETTAKVINITEDGAKKSLFLDQTIFYPQGGGQPSDHGAIKSDSGIMQVNSVRYNGGLVEHRGTLEGGFEVGQTVTLTLDWNRRYQYMQSHTAGHLLDEAVKDLAPEFHGIDGMHGIDNKQYVEFNGFIDESLKPQLEMWIADVVRANEPITSEVVTKADIEARHIYLPFELPSNKPLRLVTFGNREPVPDGGTQLATTGELWSVTIGDFEYAEGKTRIHYEVKSKVESRKSEVIETNDKNISLDEFKEKIDLLKKQAEQDNENENYDQEYLGKKGKFNDLAKSIRSIASTQRSEAGQLLNQLKTDLEGLRVQALGSRKEEWFDVTIPGIPPQIGHIHLITQAIEEISAIFTEIGFVRRRYPEIETDWYYAEGLNIPKDHPARDDQETFYISENVVLTAHTSNGQLREMELLGKPPIKMINIGKTYRRQASNTHSPMFHQFEGLLVDKGITMSHLVGVSNYFAKRYFGPDREIRLRPHHFQFTEPSFEVDINCYICKGTGKIDGQRCKVCKSGWLELGGAGMVHPNVLRNGGIDPNEYSGFAFGWGVERVIMMKHQITDNLRQLYTDDLRFLQQS